MELYRQKYFNSIRRMGWKESMSEAVIRWDELDEDELRFRLTQTLMNESDLDDLKAKQHYVTGRMLALSTAADKDARMYKLFERYHHEYHVLDMARYNAEEILDARRGEVVLDGCGLHN